jgi:hypothetical protein
MNVTSISAIYNGAAATPVCTIPEIVAPNGKCSACEATYTVAQADLNRGYVETAVRLEFKAPWEYNADNTAWRTLPASAQSAESQPKSVPADKAPFVEIVQTAVSTGSDPDKLTAGERSGGTCSSSFLCFFMLWWQPASRPG